MSTIITKSKNNNLAKQFILLQLNDALFPIGNYTQSYGLETYVQQNRVSDKVSLELYLHSMLVNNLLYNDLLLVKLAYEAVVVGNIDAVQNLDELTSAIKPAREIREASIKLGSRFIKTVRSMLLLEVSQSIYSLYCQLVADKICAGHFAVLYGVLCAALEIDYSAAISHYAYAQVSAVVNNAVKLIPLSQSVGQQILYATHPLVVQILEQLELLTVTDLGRSAPAFELRSMQHESLYSRLYMS